jgi:hypothetical protein
MITQTQMEALASFFSSIPITSFVTIQMPLEREQKPQNPHPSARIETLGQEGFWGITQRDLMKVLQVS